MMKCPQCEKKLIRQLSTRSAQLDKAMNQQTRPYRCSCGFAENTVEMFASEVSELRRKAYLYQLSQSKA